MSRINTYHHVRLVEIERADLTEQQGNGGARGKADTMPTWPLESTPDDHRPNKQPGDTLKGAEGRYNWRADLANNTYRYDKLVEPRGLEGREKPTTITGNLQPIRALTHWINEIHGRGGDAARGRPLADSPISNHNSWERVPTHPTYDTPLGVYDGGGAYVPETPMETSEERPGVAQPKFDTQTGVFDGGCDHARETPPAAGDNRPIRAYIIRVDKMKTINSGLKDTRDRLKSDKKDKLKLCSAATQSADSVATE